MASIPEIYGKPGHNGGSPTLLEKLDLAPALMSVFGTGLWQLLSGPFRGDQGSDTYKHHITHAFLRKFTVRLNSRQIHYLAPPLRTLYKQYCAAHASTPNIVTLKSGIDAFWVGSPDAKQVIIYFHGGGFSLDGGAEHLNYWGQDIGKHLNDKTPNAVSFLFLAYTLVPYATYPTQIREAVEALEYLTGNLKRSPSTISLAGDSAGGNMCLAVLSHLLHPHPDLPLLKLDSPLKSLILVAPWTSFRTDFPSAKTNAHRDIVSVEISRRWSTAYLAGAASTPYAEALDVDGDWWKGADTRVDQILCVVGSDELLLDPITQWVAKYRTATSEGHLEFVVGYREIHIAPLIEPFLADAVPTQQGEAIKSFLEARL
ncbi:uncharacterized protein HMPREF1541_07384 [Cyphellophora europaea CBS 101466]|uniref:Alpha/beta hydrolase fold-3 domain-containing protein n=1 Tax=Cyphellophora europaea (strain CBS 101466) TaxID=1220924 RepID=W2RMM4_CYPE1|nr:uncharacterized protein HMPREF1541_07384 [Cyphellophora europaea CBS 101466]ETN37761.1 hypothetical protein HMPREF1541_07384 [Cyphellophora europaea CBS 101466]